MISGYLITSLLLAEYKRGGHIKVGRFWARRARRLLPAVGVLIAVTMVVAAIVEPDRIDQLRGDAVASLFYFANWHFIFEHQSYFDQFQRPSLFRHLWSLSVEEQFYLFWPLVFAAGMKFFGRRRLILGVLAGAIGSVALAWILFNPDDASRVYYGTDTHAVGLLAGVALALAWSPWDLRRGTPGRWTGPILDTVGVLGLGYVVLCFIHVHDYDLALFHGGYVWLSLATVLLIGVLAHPAARLGGLLAQRPMTWLGLRSYSFYLWHWPLLALTRPGIDISLARGILIPLQLVATLGLAELLLSLRRGPLPPPAVGCGAGQRLEPLRATGAPGRRAGDRHPRRLERDRIDRAEAADRGRLGGVDREGDGRPPCRTDLRGTAGDGARRLGDGRGQGKAGDAPRPPLLDERQDRPPGR